MMIPSNLRDVKVVMFDASFSSSDLESMIAKRMEERGRQADKYLDALAEKYGKPKKGKKK